MNLAEEYKTVRTFLLIVIAISVFIMLLLWAHSNELQNTIDSLPFDPRLCEPTGYVENTYTIGKHGVMIPRVEQVLDCSKIYK